MEEDDELLEITYRQLQQGYFERVDGIVYKQNYFVIDTTEHGTYIVKNPKVTK